MRKLAVFLLCIMFMCMYANTPFTAADEPLLNAYLENDMPVWRAFIHATDWEQATQAERQRVLAYEYGYCAAMIEVDELEAEKATNRFREHIESMKGSLPKGHYEMYLSAVYTYEFKLDVSKNAFAILRYANRAVELNSKDPMILGHMGNIFFYAPKGIGDKKKALQYFKKASMVLESTPWQYSWYRVATRLSIAQCHEKIGDRASALSMVNAILDDFPNFTYIRDIYLPALRIAK